MIDGALASLTATSLYDRCELGSYWSSLGTVISPDRQKEKNVVSDAAHSIILLNETTLFPSHTVFILRRIEEVIGRRERAGFPALPASTLTPFSICLSRGM